MYIRILEILGLATVKKVAPKPRFAEPRAVDFDTLHAVIANRYDVLSRYAKSLKQTYAHELERLRRWSPRDAEVLKSLRRALLRGQPKEHHPKVAEVLDKSRALHTALTMRQELVALWERSSASKEQLLRQLQDWCRRADIVANWKVRLLTESVCPMETGGGWMTCARVIALSLVEASINGPRNVRRLTGNHHDA